MGHEIWKQEERKSEQQRDEVLNTFSVGVTEANNLSFLGFGFCLFGFFYGGVVFFKEGEGFKREFMKLPFQDSDALRMVLSGKKEISGDSEVGSGYCSSKHKETALRAIQCLKHN